MLLGVCGGAWATGSKILSKGAVTTPNSFFASFDKNLASARVSIITDNESKVKITTKAVEKSLNESPAMEEKDKNELTEKEMQTAKHEAVKNTVIKRHELNLARKSMKMAQIAYKKIVKTGNIEAIKAAEALLSEKKDAYLKARAELKKEVEAINLSKGDFKETKQRIKKQNEELKQKNEKKQEKIKVKKAKHQDNDDQEEREDLEA